MNHVKQALKEGGQAGELIKVSAGAALIKSADESRRAVPFVVSTPQVDRDNDILFPLGCRFATYLQNPVVLWAHQSRSLPIGRGEDVRADEAGVTMTKVFATRDENPMAESVYRLLLGGYLNAASVGFLPQKWVWNEQRGSWAIDYLEWELTESSVVPIPSNPGALAAAKSAGVLVEPIAEWASQILDELPVEHAAKRTLYEKAWRYAADHPLFFLGQRAAASADAPMSSHITQPEPDMAHQRAKTVIHFPTRG